MVGIKSFVFSEDTILTNKYAFNTHFVYLLVCSTLFFSFRGSILKTIINENFLIHKTINKSKYYEYPSKRNSKNNYC